MTYNLDFKENTQNLHLIKWTEIIKTHFQELYHQISQKRLIGEENTFLTPNINLRLSRNLGKLINLKKRRVFKNSVLHLIWRIYLGSIRYIILHLSFLAPKNNEKLISEEELEAVKTHFQEDWKYIQSIATPTSPQTLQP